MEGKENISDTLKWLARGPRTYATKYDGYLINGCRFHVKSIENVRATQNSGVCIDAQTLMRSSANDKTLTSNDNILRIDSRNNVIGLLFGAVSIVQM